MITASSFLISRQRQPQRHSSQPKQELDKQTTKPPHMHLRPPLSKLDHFTIDPIVATPIKTSAPSPSWHPEAGSLRVKDAQETPRRYVNTDNNTTKPVIEMPSTASYVQAMPSSPVQIPVRPRSRDAAHQQKQRRHHVDRKHYSSPRPRDVHSPDAIPPSVAALLAMTSIPKPRAARSARQAKTLRERRMTVDAIIAQSNESEKEFSLSLGNKGPLDLLLTPPELLEDDDSSSISDSNIGSLLSSRTLSSDSTPSLSDSFDTDTLSSMETSPAPHRRRKIHPTRRSLEPVSSPTGELEGHPLSSPEIVDDELDFRVFKDKREEVEEKKHSRLGFRPFKSVFKSNLTASLRALRQAAKSFSTLNFPSIPPEDFLTRSILTLDPQVPFTDERRPPLLEEEPTAALRRYLNPTTTVRLEQPCSATQAPTTKVFTASIQMQTYRVQRARGSSASSGRIPCPSVGLSSTSQAQQPSNAKSEYPMPGPRQREMRENSDFIRIAVMEMAMRKCGKLDDQKPGRARWALPPRKTSTKPYVVGADGVPARWVAVTYTC
ncbi:uncharacterized protein B0T23DRAFT_112619 [Neurospora hispaniola]|uniref:Uncharacterized protein n=1 Tax=Neurospora hispaniola TaxID=588809 RepID=A0AAJ0MSD0_9PEZI|nr:hypothetical protein B0T23DRAFT_112619 [Neurospora hispaniola]